jgi:hypothetical protein
MIWGGFKYTLQGIKSNYLTFGFMFLLYKVKSLPLANYYIQRLFLVANDVFPLIAIMFFF